MCLAKFDSVSRRAVDLEDREAIAVAVAVVRERTGAGDGRRAARAAGFRNIVVVRRPPSARGRS